MANVEADVAEERCAFLMAGPFGPGKSPTRERLFRCDRHAERPVSDLSRAGYTIQVVDVDASQGVAAERIAAR
ncbi:hypothetical protein [Rhodococcus sp. OK519]|uniref:hypothetical protein n=1 Tax=Rhodococcus sp. OK519 TaxID=2135729 RepID=UPI0015E7305D